jgi:flagellar hook-associated protein 2
MGLTPLAFSGISQYSSDFQTILQRVTTIASFPLTQLRNERQDVATRRQLTQELNSSVRLLGERLTTLKDVAANRAVAATSSNNAKLTIDSVNTDTLTAYSITEVTSLAKPATETTVSSYANSVSTLVSATGNLRLNVGGTDFNISLSESQNNLIGLRDRINTLGAGVTATILTVGENENYLSITANSNGERPITLTDDPDGAATTLLTATNPGSNLNFKLNGVAVSRSTNQVNDLIPGVSFTLKNTTEGSEALTINLASDRFRLSSAISGFVDAYNAVQGKVNGQVGQSAGLLTGDYLVREAQDILRRVASFGLGEGTVKNWSDLGVTFASTGAMSFDTQQFNGLSETRLRDSFAFFRDETGLGRFTRATAAFSEDVTGLAALQLEQYDRSDSRISEQIIRTEERINLLRQNYLSKLQAADALLGQFESQRSIMKASIESLNLVLYGRRPE